MSETFIELTEEEFDDRYPVITNHLNPSAGWAYGEGRGCLFETYGEELAFVKRQDERRIWTLLDGDDGDMYLVSGFHFVNRVGYLISRETVPDDTMIQVHLPMASTEEIEEATEVP